VDFDNDGTMDMISGSYDPGDVYLFRGLGDGKYDKRELLQDENDIPLVHHPEERAKYIDFTDNKAEGDRDSDEATNWRVASFGSWVAATDWDGDEDLDMLIGSFSGSIFLRENIGSRNKPIFSGQATQIESDGQPLKESGHANPVVADWDGDGIDDLVVGSSNGSVAWYRNTGSMSNRSFGPRQELVASASDNKFLVQDLEADEDPAPAVRAQICVTDYNLDGKLDLIVGDYSDINRSKELTAEQEQEMQALMAEQKELGEAMTELRESTYGKEGEKADELDEETIEQFQTRNRKLVDAYMKLDEQVKTFYAESRSASFVWLYERK